jgi:hypothetical protein
VFPLLLVGLAAWAFLLVVVVAACRAAAQGDLALVTPARPRNCESRRRRALARALSHVR